MVLAFPVLALMVPVLPATGADNVTQQAQSGAGVVEAPWTVKKDILKYMPWGGGLDPHDYEFRLARSNHRYAVLWIKNANGGNDFVRRSRGGRWILLDPVTIRRDQAVCTVAKMREAGFPRSVRRDFVAGKICYR